MSFPVTQPTLIRRIISSGDSASWQQFFNDYWLAVCGFIQRRTGVNACDAEDMASETLKIIVSNKLLKQWCGNPSAKLRTLICNVACKVISNHARVASGRKKILEENAYELLQRDDLKTYKSQSEAEEVEDIFYAEWVKGTVSQSLEKALIQFHARGKGDYVRVFYGKVCENMSVPTIAETMELKITQVENYLKAVRKHLLRNLKETIFSYAMRYAEPGEVDNEFNQEWDSMYQFFQRNGGLEEIVNQAYIKINQAQA